jgi:hypothetical protein
MLSYAEDGRNPAEAQERRVPSAHKTRRLKMSGSDFGKILQRKWTTERPQVQWRTGRQARRASSLLTRPRCGYGCAASMIFQRTAPREFCQR